MIALAPEPAIDVAIEGALTRIRGRAADLGADFVALTRDCEAWPHVDPALPAPAARLLQDLADGIQGRIP